MKKLYLYAGIAASCVMICIGIGSIVVGFNGRDTVRDELALFSAYDALARQGDVRLIELQRSYARLRGVAAGTPGLGPDYLDQLGEQLESWKRRAGTPERLFTKD
jgi:hypothetical protein